MTKLSEILVQRIMDDGPLSVADYMAACLMDETYGYYRCQDPFGTTGDFITAPEISQIFGEMLAAFLSHIHEAMAAPDNAFLFEAGPGRGTLAADMLRAYQLLGQKLADAPFHLYEASPLLRDSQAKAIAPKIPIFCDDLTNLPQAPLFGVANEFFDALGVDQAIYHNGQWHERQIGISDDRLSFVTGAILDDNRLADFRPLPDRPSAGDIIETSKLGSQLMAQLSTHIAQFGGALLIIDYGKADNQGDSLQAVRDHQPCDILSHQGEADITHWVDFAHLARIAAAQHARLIGPVPQGRFLWELGISARAEALKSTERTDQNRQLLAAIDRLVSPAQMGQAFKVALLVPRGEGLPPGFASLAENEIG